MCGCPLVPGSVQRPSITIGAQLAVIHHCTMALVTISIARKVLQHRAILLLVWWIVFSQPSHLLICQLKAEQVSQTLNSICLISCWWFCCGWVWGAAHDFPIFPAPSFSRGRQECSCYFFPPLISLLPWLSSSLMLDCNVHWWIHQAWLLALPQKWPFVVGYLPACPAKLPSIKQKFIGLKGGPFMLKGRPRLAEWFILQIHCSLAKHWGRRPFLFEKAPHLA